MIQTINIYDKYRNKKKVTAKSYLIPAPAEFKGDKNNFKCFFILYQLATVFVFYTVNPELLCRVR